MTPRGESDERAVWKAALAPSSDCIAIEKLAGPLSDADAKHARECPRCQAELALLLEFSQPAQGAGESAAVTWIAQELRRRSAASVERKPSWWRRLTTVPVYRLSGALAALLVVAGGITMYTLRSRSNPSPDVGGSGALRSVSVVLTAPIGDLDSQPTELRWQPTAGAATYLVEVLEVDRHSLWKSETAQTRLSIPGNVRAIMLPGKAVLWQVTAMNSARNSVATSALQKFRVKVKKTTGDEL